MDSTVEPFEDRIVKDVSMPPLKPLDHDLLFPLGDLEPPSWEVLRDFLKAEGKLTKGDVITIIRRARDIFYNEPNVLKLDYPVNIVGDVHGQYYDLLTVFSSAGCPSDTQYLFLGDYVDRGIFSVEVVLLLYTIKLNFPATFYMLRGNHECRQMTSHFNFMTECEHKYDIEVYEEFMLSFDALPLCATIHDRFFALHGGISPDLGSINDINALNRYQEPPSYGLLCDLLWADPYSEEGERGIYNSNKESLLRSFESEAPCSNGGSKSKISSKHGQKSRNADNRKIVSQFVYNDLRGCSYTYGVEATQQFLEKNNLLCIVRAHEAQLEGYKMQYNNPVTGFPGVITIFSAPNYCDVHNNKGAILKLGENTMRIQQFTWSRHPYYLPNFMDIFTWSVPFVSEKVLEMLHALLGKGSGENVDDVELPASVVEFIWGNKNSASDALDPTEVTETSMMLAARGNTIRKKVKSIARILQLYNALKMRNEMIMKLQDSSPESPAPLKVVDREVKDEKQQVESFRLAQSIDIVNERRPDQ